MSERCIFCPLNIKLEGKITDLETRKRMCLETAMKPLDAIDELPEPRQSEFAQMPPEELTPLEQVSLGSDTVSNQMDDRMASFYDEIASMSAGFVEVAVASLDDQIQFTREKIEQNIEKCLRGPKAEKKYRVFGKEVIRCTNPNEGMGMKIAARVFRLPPFRWLY